MPKAVWRKPSTCRTLPPVVLEPLIDSALQNSQAQHTPANLIESEVAADGSRITNRISRKLKESDWAGVFDFTVAGQDVKIRLSQEACGREVYTPRRSSQFLAVLKPWEPIRVILNGKADWHSDRYYYLQDYYVILCGPVRAEVLLSVRTFDLQADLL